jgi:branched-chain amino acid transport system ATP-binding protein
VVERILELLRSVSRDGTGVLLVEQHIHHALAIADRAIVLSGGQVVLQRPASALLDDLDLLHTAYLGPTGPAT